MLNAYEQLFAEGYVEGKVGSGTYVTCTLPGGRLQAATASGVLPAALVGHPPSRRGALLAATLTAAPWARDAPRAFQPSLPAVDAFPYRLWAKLVAHRWSQASYALLGYSHPSGYGPLREAIATYLRDARAVNCDAEQVIVVAGSQQALDLSARVLLDDGDATWIEDPGYPGARHALLSAGAHIVPVPVDEEGLDVAAGAARCARPRLIYVTPSYQFPLGVTMSLRRRLALLDFAGKCNAWVVEDDYNSEYRYAGRPLAALQGLDVEGRVIYVGTFSKVLLPSLRVGYVVVPRNLVSVFVAARAATDRQSPLVVQAVITDFITEGHFARHIQRMRTLYAKRQAILVRAAASELAGLIEVRPSEAGMHLLGWLPEGIDDLAASRQAASFGLEARPLSLYSICRPQRGGLALGYTCVSELEIREGVRRLAAALRSLVTSA